MCEPTKEGVCDCKGLTITCLCGVCQKCGRGIKTCKEAKEDVESFLLMWKDYPVEVQINALYDWNGKIFKENVTKLEPCFRALTHLTVQCDGKVTFCCMDIGENIIGDLSKQTIAEVWENSEWRRLMHTQGKRPCIDVCKRCTI